MATIHFTDGAHQPLSIKPFSEDYSQAYSQPLDLDSGCDDEAHGAATPEIDIAALRKLEHAVLDLEDAALTVLDAHKGHAFHDVDFLYWDRKLKNIATPISLALSECKGPRVFHQHYRHDPADYEHMIPVMESATKTLLKVCRNALIRSSEMVGSVDRSVVVNKIRLEQSIRGFINCYNAAV